MEAACQRTSEHLRLRYLQISHAVEVLVLVLAFYSKDPDGMGHAINTFLFPELSPLEGSETALLAHIWDAILGGKALILFVETILLLVK